MSKKPHREDLMRVYEDAVRQLGEDRASILDVFNELREFVREDPHKYADFGEVLAKLADLRIKQTAQSIKISIPGETPRAKIFDVDLISAGVARD